LKDAAVRFFLDPRKREGVAIKCDCVLISVGGTFDRNICAGGKLRSVELGHHVVDLNSLLIAVKDARVFFARWFSLFPKQSRYQRSRRGRWEEMHYLWRCRASGFGR